MKRIFLLVVVILVLLYQIATFQFFFRWYDLWVGVYIDTSKRAVYICPVPTLGVKASWRH